MHRKSVSSNPLTPVNGLSPTPLTKPYLILANSPSPPLRHVHLMIVEILTRSPHFVTPLSSLCFEVVSVSSAEMLDLKLYVYNSYLGNLESHRREYIWCCNLLATRPQQTMSSMVRRSILKLTFHFVRERVAHKSLEI